MNFGNNEKINASVKTAIESEISMLRIDIIIGFVVGFDGDDVVFVHKLFRNIDPKQRITSVMRK